MDNDLQWEFANTLGEGAYGEVKLAVHTRTQEIHAIKIISLNLLNDKSAIQKEVLIHKALNHENIIKFLTSFQQADKYFIVLEYASGGELFDRIEPDYGMQKDLAHKYFQQLINGVEYIHSKGIVHRDLKPENLLLNDNDTLKIADFGLATLFQYKGVERLLTSPCGTAPYVATEVLSQKEYKAEPTDIWSCGIILVAMLAGELPWDKPVVENKEFSDWIENDYYKRTPWCKLENTALSLLRRMLFVDATQRINLKQIQQSAWYMRTMTFETTRNTFALSQQNQIYLSQPNYATSPIEMQIHDSNDDCTCIESTEHLHSHIQSFSQPISTDNMILNSQANTQNLSSQLSQVSPFIRLVKRMTRMFVHMSVDQAVETLKKLFQKYMFEFKVHNTVASHRQRQITVTTVDKRQMPLTFQVNMIEMNSLQNDILVDFRLSKGDGLEFKKIFMKIKSNLDNFVCKKYVFMNPSQCCDGH